MSEVYAVSQTIKYSDGTETIINYREIPMNESEDVKVEAVESAPVEEAVEAPVEEVVAPEVPAAE